MFPCILPARELSRPFSNMPTTPPQERKLACGLSLILSAQPVICVLPGDTEPAPAEKTCFAQLCLWLGKYVCLILGWNINKSFWFKGLPCSSADKESACNAVDPSSIPGLGRSTGEGKGYSLQYSVLENSMDSIVHGVTNSQTWPSSFHIIWYFCPYRSTLTLYMFFSSS